MNPLRRWIRAIDLTKKSAGMILPDLLDQIAVSHGDQVALLGETEQLTYRQLIHRVNGYAASAIRQQITGQTVALLMPNCPDYAAVWLGLIRVGCKVALLNTSLHRDSLMHCIRAVDAKYLIGSHDLINDVPLLELDANETILDWPLPRPSDVALFIYTSGTTGLPKAANITHRRITEWSHWFAGMTAATPNDRLYDCLPMYHSIGGIVAVGSMLVSGGSVVIRQRFSASRFWDDVVETQCSIFQYIGELCRYLTSAPTNVNERHHTLRLAVGNGLQADIWRSFQERFAIPQILEYYAATEGVLSLYNCEGKPGAIGHIPPVLEPYLAVKLIQVDTETDEPKRSDNGFCIESQAGEPGEAICLLRSDRAFDGYNDVDASGRKILRNVFVDGDQWFRTGDLMRRDAEGFYYFVDRMGDTFRWKGENVSTTEVANVVRQCPGVIDAIVYGVQVAGNEGRAGMAAVVSAEMFSLEALALHLDQQLPSYARPLFVRLCTSLDATATFKHTKNRFAAESYTSSSDPVYIRHDRGFVRAETV